MIRDHGKRSLWAAAAAGVLILAAGSAGLAQSLPDTSVSSSVTGQDVKMGAVLDSLKAAGLEQSNQRASQAVQEARVGAAVQTQSAEVQTQAPDSSIRSYIDTLKAAGRMQANQRAAQAVKEAQGAGPQGPSQAPGQAPGQSQGTQISQATQEQLQAARVASQQALENARVSSQQALERAKEQAGMNESALKGAPPAFRDALERIGGRQAQAMAGNASRGSRGSRHGGATTH